MDSRNSGKPLFVQLESFFSPAAIVADCGARFELTLGRVTFELLRDDAAHNQPRLNERTVEIPLALW